MPQSPEPLSPQSPAAAHTKSVRDGRPFGFVAGVPADKLRAVREILRSSAPVVIAYSGGVDSACLLALAARILEPGQFLGAIADSPSLPRKALADALELARGIPAPVEVVETAEFDDENYLSNPSDRCYFCKSALFERLRRVACDLGFAAIAYGENADDPPMTRPGSRAASEFSVIAPLKAAGLTKAEVRAISRELGLPTHDAPAQPCLSSRIPHGTRVTASALALVERGESFVRSRGFRVFRVRYIAGPPVCARLQVAPAELSAVDGREGELVAGLLAAGFDAAEIDPEGYRSP